MEQQVLSSNWKQLQAKLKLEKSEATPILSSKRKVEGDNQATRNDLPSSNKRAKTANGTVKCSSGEMNGNNMSLRRSKSTVLSTQKTSTKASRLEDAAPSRPATSHGVHLEQTRTVHVNEGVSPSAMAGRYIALDCEMVGYGLDPDNNSQLARVSLVNYHGEQIYDSFVIPQLPVTDYRTPVSGIRPQNLKPDVARAFKEVQSDVDVFLKGRILVGHALKNDFAALLLSHPRRDIRDTARYPKFRDLSAGRTPALRRLAKELLGIDIQSGEHSSVEDARVCMLLYRREKDGFEAENTKLFGRSKDDSQSKNGATVAPKRKKKKR